MELIGMLHHRKNPENVTKSYAYAASAKAEGAELLFFSPNAVNLDDKVINGYIYQNGKWQNIESPFPDVIYNTGSPIKLARSRKIIHKLKEDIPFTTHSIGNKMRIYKRLKEADEFTRYLIPSDYIYNVKHFFNLFKYYRKIVFKPVYGHKGKDIIFIEAIGDEYSLLIDSDKYLYTWNELKEFIEAKLDKELYLIQPFINSKTKSGLSYDLRLHVQKNGEGKWEITTIYPRIAPVGSIVSNINNGGSTNYAIPFLKQEYGDEYYNKMRYLETFGLQLAKHMDKIQYKHFKERIDELGIDVGLDDMGKAWIYEINWRPGCPPAFYLEMDTVKRMIKYALYLSRKSKIEKAKITAQTEEHK